MATGATIYKVQISLSDMDRNYYAEHKLTLALHPSEKLDRMMVRLLAFCLHASDTLEFTRGLSSVNEPALWDKDYSGQITAWIEVGQPPFDRMKKARGQAEKLYLYSFGRGRDSWWQSESRRFQSLKNLAVMHLSDEDVSQLVSIAEKKMMLTVCITDGSVFLTCGDKNITIQPMAVNEK